MKPILILAGVALLAAPAAAQDVAPASTAPALSAIIAGLEAQGYRITEVDVDRGEIEVDALAPDGRRKDLLLDPATGAVLSETIDH